MMDNLNKTTVLFEDDGWLLLKANEDESFGHPLWHDDNPYKSGIYHKCVKHPQIKRVSGCWQEGRVVAMQQL
ncbi:hypothetical protein LCGC14_2039720 [marine sediment metagenome]|uniref:Uncharacterized protein n=1 Tax=marine sediment metagenome TaxID=412755 RepID=A0A0F9H5P4_9ZZZZ